RFPFGGTEIVLLRRIDLLIAASVVALLMMHASRLEPAAGKSGYRRALVLAAAAAIAAYTNFFSFHHGSWMHLHDVAHYYLGSKYAAEVDYGELYSAILRAEREEYGNLLTSQARDLDHNYIVPSEQLLGRGEEVEK